jgi:biotin carboxyl carrier protein
MIKKLRVTVDGNSYDVTVEMSDEVAPPGNYAPPVAAPTAAPASAPVPVPAPVAAPAPPPAPPVSAPPAPATASSGKTGPGSVLSPLAGRVTAIVATPGQEVKENDHLLTLEAMKMNTFVLAPKAGKVAEIKVVVGDAVEEGFVLARIE